MDTTSWTHFSPSEVQSFMRRCMESVNVKPAHAEVLAEVLMKADYRGHYSHGLNRLGKYSIYKHVKFPINCLHTKNNKNPFFLHDCLTLGDSLSYVLCLTLGDRFLTVPNSGG